MKLFFVLQYTKTKMISCWLMQPLRELTWRSPREAVPAPRPSRAAASEGEPRAPLSCGLGPREETVASCSLLALVRSTENAISVRLSNFSN